MGVVDERAVLIAEVKLLVLGAQAEGGAGDIHVFHFIGAEDHGALTGLKSVCGKLVKGPVAAAVGQVVVAELYRAAGDVFKLYPVGILPVLGQVPLVIDHDLADDQGTVGNTAFQILGVPGGGVFKARGGRAGGDDVAHLAAVYALVRAGGGQVKALDHRAGGALQGQGGAFFRNGKAAVAVIPAVAAAEDHGVSARFKADAGDRPALSAAAEIIAGEIDAFGPVVIQLYPVGEKPVVIGQGALIGGHHLVDAHGDEHSLRRLRDFRRRLRRHLHGGRGLLYRVRLLRLAGLTGTGPQAQQQG